MRSCSAVAAHRCQRTTPPQPRVATRCAGGAGLAPPTAHPTPHPLYRGVRGVRGSTVGGAHTAHARPARFHARLPVRLINPVGASAKTTPSACGATLSG